MPANYNLRCRWDQTFRLPRDFSPYDTQLQAGAVARMEMTFANGYVLEFSSLSGDGKDGTFVYDSYKKGWFICPLNKLAALYLTFGGSSKALSATWAARLEKDGASQIVMSGRAIWSAPDITETGDSSSTGTGTGTFGQTVFVDGETDGVTPPLPIDFSTAVAMATQLAQDWATKTSAEVVAGQGYGAKKYAIDALASYTSALAIAAGLSASPYAYMLDGVNPAALFSAPKGLFMLNGAIVALSSLLSFSSAAKYTVGPDGNYVLNSANGPAYDWSTGRRRLLIEAIGATNLTPSPEDASTGWTPERTTASVASNALYGIFALTTITSLGAIGDNRSFGYSPFSGDRSITFSCALLAENGGNASLGIYDTATLSYGSNATVTARVKRGPGAVAVQAGGLVNTSSLSATVPTEVEIVRTFTGSAPTTAYSMFYANWSAAGQIIKIGMPQHEDNVKVSSSYIPNNTPRPPDIVTASSGLLALMTAANAAIVMRGKVFVGDGALFLSNRFYGSRIFNGGVDISLDGATSMIAFTPGNAALATFGAAMTSGGGVRKAALTGGSVVSSVEPWLSASDTTIRFGDYVGSSYSANYLLDELIVWPIFASDAGLQAQARVYS